jgi:hypothetical protein
VRVRGWWGDVDVHLTFEARASVCVCVSGGGGGGVSALLPRGESHDTANVRDCARERLVKARAEPCFPLSSQLRATRPRVSS